MLLLHLLHLHHCWQFAIQYNRYVSVLIFTVFKPIIWEQTGLEEPLASNNIVCISEKNPQNNTTLLSWTWHNQLCFVQTILWKQYFNSEHIFKLIQKEVNFLKCHVKYKLEIFSCYIFVYDFLKSDFSLWPYIQVVEKRISYFLT